MSGTNENEGSKYSHLYTYSGANKAGMEGIDKEKQAQIIYELSKDSAYFKRAAKLDAETDVKVQAMKGTLVSFKGFAEKKLRESVAEQSLNLENRRCMDRICCVLDMDMFFAAVEIRDQPHLKDLPVAVGGMSMISTANYVARKYGVRAAMPGFMAKKLCPNLVFVNSNFDKYKVVSDQIKEIIGEYDPKYRSHSLDEVYFDLTNAAKAAWCGQHGYGPCLTAAYSTVCSSDGTGTAVNIDSLDGYTRVSVGGDVEEDDDCIGEGGEAAGDNHSAAQKQKPPQLLIQRYPCTHSVAYETVPTDDRPDIFALRVIATALLQEIRARITVVTRGLTCSAGLANNFYLAKICADVNKPDGQFALPPTRDDVLRFVSELPTRKIGGIGKVTERMLERLLEIKTMQQVRDRLPELMHTCTPVLFQFLLRTSMGIGSEEGCDEDGLEEVDGASAQRIYHRKSLGCERTYSAKGISDPAELYEKLHKICASVGEDMVRDDLYAKTVTLKLKDIEFILTTRCATSPSYVQSAEKIEAIARALLDEALPMKVRLMGVTVSKFRHAELSECDPKQPSLLSFLQEKKGASRAEEGRSCEAVGCQSPAAQGRNARDTDSEREQDLLFLGQRNGGAQRQFGIEQWLSGGGGAQRDSAAAGAAGAESDRSVRAAGNQCPVCEQHVSGSLDQLNRHLDSCLGMCPPASALAPAPASSSSSSAARPASAASSISAAAPPSTVTASACIAPSVSSAHAAPPKASSGTSGGSLSGKRVVVEKSSKTSEESAGKRQRGEPLVLSMHDYFAVSRK